MGAVFLAWLMWSLGCNAPPEPSLLWPDPTDDLMRDLDADGSGALSPDEIGELFTPEHLAAMDDDADGTLTAVEIRTSLSSYEVHEPTRPGGKAGKPGKRPGPRSGKAESPR